MSVIIIILGQNKGWCEVIAQLEREKGKCTREVKLMRCAEGGEKKGNKGAELTVAMFQYFGTAFALYLLNPLWVNEWQRLVFMSTDTVVEQLTDCLPQFIRSLLVSYQYCTACTYLHGVQWVQGSKSVRNKCIQLADHSWLILMWVFFNFCFEALFFLFISSKT